MILVAAVVGALFVQLVVCGLALRRTDEPTHIPAYVTIVAPLLVVVAARRQFVDLDPSMDVQVLVERCRVVAALGPWMCVLGVLGIAGGLAPRWRGPEHGAPSLVQTGALTLGAGLMWGPLLHGVADLWVVWEQQRNVVTELGEVRAAVWPWVLAGSLVVAVGWSASSVWGYRRYRWNGLGEGLAAGALVALVLSTGRPAARAVAGVSDPLREACSAVEALDVELPAGPYAPLHAAIVRRGSAGLERWVDGRWQAWSAEHAQRVLWVASPDLTLAELDRGIALLPAGSEVLVAGRGPVQSVEGPLFARHPVVASRGCGAWMWRIEGKPGTRLGDALSELP